MSSHSAILHGISLLLVFIFFFIHSFVGFNLRGIIQVSLHAIVFNDIQLIRTHLHIVEGESMGYLIHVLQYTGFVSGLNLFYN